MKKVLAILLALLMVCSLVACGAKQEAQPSPSESASPSAPAESQKPEESAEPTESEVKEDEKEKEDYWWVGDGIYNPQTHDLSDGTASGVKVDPYSRETYQFVYLCSSLATQWCKDIADTLETFEEEYNFKLTVSQSNSKNDVFLQLVETFCGQNVDGMVMNAPEEACQTIVDMCAEAKIPILFESTAFIDADGKMIGSGVELNAWGCGAGCSEWLFNNYKDYFGDIDLSKAGFIPVTYSPVVSFFNRHTGAVEKWLELAEPEGFLEEHVFMADLVTAGGFNAEYAYNEVAAILAGHQEIEYWFMVCVQDTPGQGAVRAIEAAQKEDCSLICSVGGSVLITEWAAGYEGPWAACNFYEAYTFSEYLAPGLCQLADGTATPETLWPDWKDPTGQTDFCSVRIIGQGVTKWEHEKLARYITTA